MEIKERPRSFDVAREMSLKKWHAIKDAYPDPKKMIKESRNNPCGFCGYFMDERKIVRCDWCSLSKSVCYSYYIRDPIPLYYMIGGLILSLSEGQMFYEENNIVDMLKGFIDLMILSIEKAKEQS